MFTGAHLPATSIARPGRTAVLGLLFLSFGFLSPSCAQVPDPVPVSRANPIQDAASSQVSGASCSDLLPPPDFHPGWIADGTPETFTRDTLYEHIDGEAELYLPYGLDSAAAGYYKAGEGSKAGLAVDIYRMGSLLDAFGIYGNYRSPEGEAVQVGVEGEVSPTQLLFFQDRYFVRINSSGREPPAREAILACAHAISAKLPPASWPQELALVQAPGIASRTEKFVAESLLGYRFFPRGLTAEASIDGTPVKLFVVLAGSPASATACLKQYADSLRQSGITPPVEGDSRAGRTLFARDQLYKGILLHQRDGLLYGIAKIDNPSKAQALLERWLSKSE